MGRFRGLLLRPEECGSLAEIRDKVIELAQSWRDGLYEALSEAYGEEQGNELYRLWAGGFPASYTDMFSPRRAAIDLELPLSFHILTTREERPRGPKMNAFLTVMRGCQDIMGTLVLGGVFERHPALKVVCVEADAGWVPHYMYRLDHAYKRHRNWLPAGQELSKLPSEYFAENIYITFQDDWVAFKTADLMNWKRLMWANDFPHSDSTWPWSQEMLAEHAADLTAEQREHILCRNVSDLYKIDCEALH